MIHDGLWQDDLISFSNEIMSYKNRINELILSNISYGDEQLVCARHELTKRIFFSASIIRKIVEEEEEFFEFRKKYKKDFSDERTNPNEWYFIHSYQIKTIEFPLKEEAVNYFEDYCVEDYDQSCFEKKHYTVKEVSNWIMHSYIWWLGSLEDTNLINGFFISSDYDKNQFVNYISLDDWEKALLFCADKAYL